MANVTTKIAGQDVTLIDNGDGTYRIDLNTFQARRFIREGELAQLRAERDEKIAQRDLAAFLRDNYNASRLEQVAVRDALVAEIAEINTNIDELVAWLQGQGDV